MRSCAKVAAHGFQGLGFKGSHQALLFTTLIFGGARVVAQGLLLEASKEIQRPSFMGSVALGCERGSGLNAVHACEHSGPSP